jgi:hypothetical protein
MTAGILPARLRDRATPLPVLSRDAASIVACFAMVSSSL